MKKVSLMAVVVLILVGMLSTSLVSAQDEAPACSPEEVTEAMDILGEAFGGLEEMSALPEEPTTSDFSTMIVVLDSFSYGYWEGLYESAEAGELCAEIEYLGVNSGFVFDELLIVSLLSALGVHEDAAGNADIATSFVEQAEARQAALEAGLEEMTATFDALEAGEAVELYPEYPACTQEELDATMGGIEEVVGIYLEFSNALEGATGTDLSALVDGYAQLSGGYWSEFFPELPACAEIQENAFNFGLLLDETVIVTGLLRLAELEAETGDAELAEALATSAATRAEDLEAAAAEMFGGEE
jgi:hypothetical protein